MNISSTVSIVSWNVAGFLPGVWEWMIQWLKDTHPDVVFLQETHMREKDLQDKFSREPLLSSHYTWLIHAHQRPSNIHGVAMLIRCTIPYKQIPVLLDGCLPRDTDNKDIQDAGLGRVLAVCIAEQVNLVGTYGPNAGSERKNPLKHLDYRVKQWDPALHTALKKLAKQLPTIWMGDLNVAPTPLDVSDPVKMSEGKGWAGFTLEERKSHQDFCAAGQWIDVWRQSHPKEQGKTWTSSRSSMRLDHILAHASAVSNVEQAWIARRVPAIQGSSPSDHVPVGIKYRLSEDRRYKNWPAIDFEKHVGKECRHKDTVTEHYH